MFADAAGVPQTINLRMYSLSLRRQLNECIFMTWQNDGLRPPRNEAFCRNSTPVCPFRRTAVSCLPMSVCLCLALCIWSCPHINPSIYSRSLPMISLSLLLVKWAVGAALWIHSFVLAVARKRGWEKERERKKAPLTGGQTPVSPCPPLSPLSPSARHQQTTGIWREGGQEQKSRGFVRAAGLRPRWKSREREKEGRRDGDGGEGTGMTSPQDPLHPLPLYCKRRQESLPPSPVWYLHMSSDHIRSDCSWPRFPVTHTLFRACMPKRWLAFPLSSITSQWRCNLTHYIHHGAKLHRACKFAPSFPSFTQLIHQLLCSTGAFSPALFFHFKCKCVQFVSIREEMERITAGVGGVWRGGMGRARAWARGVVGYKPRDSGFSVVVLLPSVLASCTPPHSLYLSFFFSSFHSHSLQSWDSSSSDSCQVCGIGLLGAPVEARNHADVFGAGVGCPPGNR